MVLELCSNLPDRSREEQGEGLPKNRHQRHSAAPGTQLGLLCPLGCPEPWGRGEEARGASPEKTGTWRPGEKVYSISTVTKSYLTASPSSDSSHTTRCCWEQLRSRKHTLSWGSLRRHPGIGQSTEPRPRHRQLRRGLREGTAWGAQGGKGALASSSPSSSRGEGTGSWRQAGAGRPAAPWQRELALKGLQRVGLERHRCQNGPGQQ